MKGGMGVKKAVVGLCVGCFVWRGEWVWRMVDVLLRR